MDPAESSLVTRCRAGDSAAWDELFDRHYEPAARFVWQLHAGFTAEDVEEICQEAFLTVIRSLDGFQGQSRLQTWIFRIAANKAHDHREKLTALKRGGGKVTISLQAEDPETGLALDPPANTPSPDDTLLRKEQEGLIGEALARLGGPCEEIVELRYFADLSYEEIAKALNLNPKTVSSRLSKCLDKLEEIARPMLAGEKNTTPSV
jgi:RNA polymerase sigma-70 factor (ECF subfamily)